MAKQQDHPVNFLLSKANKTEDRDEYAKGGGIHIKPSHKGLLHKDTGTPAGQPISADKLSKALHSSDPAVRRRANFARNAKRWNSHH